MTDDIWKRLAKEVEEAESVEELLDVTQEALRFTSRDDSPLLAEQLELVDAIEEKRALFLKEGKLRHIRH